MPWVKVRCGLTLGLPCSGPTGLAPFKAEVERHLKGTWVSHLQARRSPSQGPSAPNLLLCHTTSTQIGSHRPPRACPGASPEAWPGRFVFLHLVTSSAWPSPRAGPILSFLGESPQRAQQPREPESSRAPALTRCPQWLTDCRALQTEETELALC